MPVQSSCGRATSPRLECGNGGEARPPYRNKRRTGNGELGEGCTLQSYSVDRDNQE